jgi:hypothetical protein
MLVTVLPSVLGGQKARASEGAAPAAVFQASVGAADGGSRASGGAARQAAGTATRTCEPVSRPDDYVNPLADARVTAERVDQGVDYAGSGTLVALGAGRVTYVGTSGTGWPGAFLEYQLSNGADAGCFVYYAEGIKPAAGMRAGDQIRAGQTLATIIPGWSSGVEIGWGAGVSTKTYAAKRHQWNAARDANSVASAAGKSFSALVAALGGPAGRIEG